MNRFRDESGSVYWRSSESGIETLRTLEGIGTTGVLFAESGPIELRPQSTHRAGRLPRKAQGFSRDNKGVVFRIDQSILAVG
jgi:hypothetical protein